MTGTGGHARTIAGGGGGGGGDGGSGNGGSDGGDTREALKGTIGHS